jgi:enoyl-CoA hydratase
MTEQFETISVAADRAKVETISLNRPQVANALNTRMAHELTAYFEMLGPRLGDVRCVILTGSGEKAFCAGGDLKERHGMSVAEWMEQHLVFERMARAIEGCPVPIIAAVNGAAYGGGCEIAGLCDFIYAAERARFALTEVTLGIIPGAAGTQTLPRAVGERRAKELILTGCAFSAREAVDWGFVNAAFPNADLLLETARIAERIAANAPLAVRQAKQSIRKGIGLSLPDGMAFEIEAYGRLVATEDRTEGVDAYNERREPQFKGR